MRLLAGVTTGGMGQLTFSGGASFEADQWSREDAGVRARRLGYLPQELVSNPPFTVREVVGFGRFAHYGGRLFENDEDRAITARFLEQFELSDLAERDFSSLSGGERKRAHIARVMCQQAPILVLDEPAADLDPRHQVQVLQQVRDWAAHHQGAALISVHDVNLAARFADHIVFLRSGRVHAEGSPSDVINQQVLREVFEVDFTVGAHPTSGAPYALLD